MSDKDDIAAVGVGPVEAPGLTTRAADGPAPAIRCVNVWKTYRAAGGARGRSGGRRGGEAREGVRALQGLDLQIDGPGFFAIMGRSGSGKSTLMHLLAALDRPDAPASGTQSGVWVGGRPVHAMSEADAVEHRRRGVGVVFQQFNLIQTMTAIENVQLPGLLAGDDEHRLRERAGSLLDQLGLAGRAEHRPEALSGGEQQRVAIARALLYAPPVILADEPTGALDSRTSAVLWELLGRVARDHATTVVMVTHDPAAAAHCERVFMVRDGLIAGEFSTEGLDAGGVAARAERALG